MRVRKAVSVPRMVPIVLIRGWQTTPRAQIPPAAWFCKWSVFGTQPHTFMYALSLAAFMPQWQGWVFIQSCRLYGRQSQKIFTTWPLDKKFAARNTELPQPRPHCCSVCLHHLAYSHLPFVGKAQGDRKTSERDRLSPRALSLIGW